MYLLVSVYLCGCRYEYIYVVDRLTETLTWKLVILYSFPNFKQNAVFVHMDMCLLFSGILYMWLREVIWVYICYAKSIIYNTVRISLVHSTSVPCHVQVSAMFCVFLQSTKT